MIVIFMKRSMKCGIITKDKTGDGFNPLKKYGNVLNDTLSNLP